MIPKNLKQCFGELSKSSNKDIIQFAREEESHAVAIRHHGVGTQMRNAWGLWRRNKLTKYFNKLGIYHADDMSGIIFTSLHRYLNKRPIKLREQIKFYINYWKKLGYKNGNPLKNRN